MAVTGFSLSERFSRWEVLSTNLKEAQRSNPAIATKLAELDSIIAEARTLLARQAEFRAQSQEITKQLIELARRGDRVRSRLGAHLRGDIGFTTEELIRYGLKPRRLPPKRRVVVVKEPGGVTPPGVQPPPGPGTTPPAKQAQATETAAGAHAAPGAAITGKEEPTK